VELENLKDLIDFTVSTEHRLLFHELSKDASDCPDIYTQAVLLLPKENLGCSVPKGLNLMGESLDG
jgi:hypothetical protein